MRFKVTSAECGSPFICACPGAASGQGAEGLAAGGGHAAAPFQSCPDCSPACKMPGGGRRARTPTAACEDTSVQVSLSKPSAFTGDLCIFRLDSMGSAHLIRTTRVPTRVLAPPAQASTSGVSQVFFPQQREEKSPGINSQETCKEHSVWSVRSWVQILPLPLPGHVAFSS